MNNVLVIFGLIAVVIVIIAFIGYAINTNKIIREQEKEIAQLRTTLKRKEQRETLYIERSGKNPQFGGF